jgi:hypothetical protein
LKTFKKILCLMLAVLAVCSLCACGGNSEPAEVPTENPVELAKAKLEEAYNTCCKGSKTEYAKLGYDGMSLTIDTDPKDYGYSKYEENAIAAIQGINLYLGLPASLLEKMSSTRALDGTQTQNCGTYTATWNYHPDNGLKVIYEVNP